MLDEGLRVLLKQMEFYVERIFFGHFPQEYYIECSVCCLAKSIKQNLNLIKKIRWQFYIHHIHRIIMVSLFRNM